MLAPARRLIMLPPELIQLVESLLALLLQALVGLLADHVVLAEGLVRPAHNVRTVSLHIVLLLIALVRREDVILDGDSRHRSVVAHVAVRYWLCKALTFGIRGFLFVLVWRAVDSKRIFTKTFLRYNTILYNIPIINSPTDFFCMVLKNNLYKVIKQWLKKCCIFYSILELISTCSVRQLFFYIWKTCML